MKIFNMFVVFTLFLLLDIIQAQVDPDLERYVRIGELQSLFSSYGAERAWNNSYYEGLIWPSLYPMQDNAVIERLWIACKDFTDNNSVNYPYYGIYFSKGYVDMSLFPVELKQIARSHLPDVYVNGIKRQTDEDEQVDEYDPNLLADRVIINVVNTSLGLTMTRKIYAFSHPNHDDYFIKEYTFQNTGNTDYDAEIERTETLQDVRIGKLPRYSTSREGAANSDNQQMWGKHSWISKRGENYTDHALDAIVDDYTIADWIRCGFSWAGQSEYYNYDIIGAPIINDFENARLSAPQFAGIAVLHVDKSSTDSHDDPQQPAILGWHAGDTYPYVGNLNPSDSLSMHQLWDFLAGTPYSAASRGGSDRMDESNLASITDRVDPYTVHGDGGGTGIWIGYGPFNLVHGESVTIVEVDGVNGLNREKCIEIGKKWLEAWQKPYQIYTFELPDGSTITGKYNDGVGNAADVYKNYWFYTGMDSILLTFSRAKRNYDSGFAIPDAPQPPMTFEVLSDTNSIILKWDNSAELYSDFAGYRIYRRTKNYKFTYNPFELIFECGQGTDYPTVVHEFIDLTVENGIDYLYSITAFDNGNSNNSRRIESNIHATMPDSWIQTGEPVILQDVYVSPSGSDNNDGLTLETPFKTIHFAIQKIQPNEINPLTIYLAEWEYSPSATGEQFPLDAKSYLTLKGVGKMKTILNAEGTNGVVQCSDVENFSLEDLSIINGYAGNGGGIYAAVSKIFMSGVRITQNHSNYYGGGLYNFFSEIEFDKTNRCDVFNNYAVNPGGDIYRSNFTDESIVYLDTFTVQTASPYQMYPPIIQIDFINAKEEQIDADLFVSPIGNDNNSGLTTDQPFKSFRSVMTKIYADSTHQHTIYLNPGVYSATDSDYSNMVFCRDFVSLKGQPDQITTLDSISLRCDFIKNVSISDLV
ncbi:MAG: DUF1565 domain-containing protein, partial [Candidatus Marinimicrobia bacterium]|nr:DUF1565 domain-containing protein [Candidatus Neomarinimicrobiota bacterium]